MTRKLMTLAILALFAFGAEAATNLVVNGDFESWTGWSGANGSWGGYGRTAGSPHSKGPHAGTYAGYIQASGSIWRDVTFPTRGKYRLSLWYSSRPSYGGQDTVATIGDQPVCTFKTDATTYSYIEADFWIAEPCTKTLKFAGHNLAGDHSTPIDDVVIDYSPDQTMYLVVDNPDDDLATVYVNDVATTNGQRVAVDGAMKIELKDFRSDYYFRFAPTNQTDRTLAFESWDGLPSGVANQNPTTFTPADQVTIRPNVDVKGYAWLCVTNSAGTITTVTNHYHTWTFRSIDHVNRGLSLTQCKSCLVSDRLTEIDFVERVRYNDRNYAIVGAYGNSPLANTKAGLVSLSPRYAWFNNRFLESTAKTFTNVLGIAAIKTAAVDQWAFYYGSATVAGDTTNWVPRHATSIGYNAYSGRSGISGPLTLDAVRTLGESALAGPSIPTLNLSSPYLTTIGKNCFNTSVKDVTIASSVITSLAAPCFKSSVTNFTFTGEPPSAANVDNMLYPYTAADGAHAVTLTVDPANSNWWHLVSQATAGEVAAGLPAGCLGAYVTAEGGRKAWVVASAPTAGILLVGDMSQSENVGYSTVSGLAPEEELTLVAPEGMKIAWIQHLVEGAWETIRTVTLGAEETSFVYTHDGMLTRVQWRVDGATLTLTSGGYAGSVTSELKSGRILAGGNIYEKGSEVWFTAHAQTNEHPYTKFAYWTVNGVRSAETNNVLKLTLTDDVTVDCQFGAAEWLYIYQSPNSKLSDGNWMSDYVQIDTNAHTVTFPWVLSVTDPKLWFDLSIPVYVPSDPSNEYWIASVGISGSFPGYRVRFGERVASVANFFYIADYLTEIEGMGRTKIRDFPYLYMRNNSAPIQYQTYEGTDFIPETWMTIGGNSTFEYSPSLVGTLRLSMMTNIVTTLGGLRIGGVTNLELLAEGLTTVTSGVFDKRNLTQLTFGSTNLQTVSATAFRKPDAAAISPIRELTFLAHAPTTNALDNILVSAATTNTTIYCSRYAPGWKAIRDRGGRSRAEWAARPEGTWGLYQTADGQKRFYMVQKDSAYDHRDGLMVIVR